MTQGRLHRRAYDADLAEAVLDALRDGEMIVDVCEELGGVRGGDVMRWTREQPEFAIALGHALRDGGLIRAERVTRKAEGRHLTEEQKAKTPREAIARDRLALSANQLLLGLYDPITFGKGRRFFTKGGWTAPQYVAPPRSVESLLDELRTHLGEDFGRWHEPVAVLDDEPGEDAAREAQDVRIEAAKLGLDAGELKLIGLGDAAQDELPGPTAPAAMTGDRALPPRPIPTQARTQAFAGPLDHAGPRAGPAPRQAPGSPHSREYTEFVELASQSPRARPPSVLDYRPTAHAHGPWPDQPP